MFYLITSDCVKCGMCMDICPVDAIIESDTIYIITEDCIQCGRCVEICPIDAIKEIKKDRIIN